MQPKGVIERTSCFIGGIDFERKSSRTKHVPIIGNTCKKTARNTLATVVLLDHEVIYLKIISLQVPHPQNDEIPLIVSNPPRAPRLRELLKKLTSAPGGMSRICKGTCFKLGNGVHIVNRHGAHLHMHRC
jgi:hypothetical protein